MGQSIPIFWLGLMLILVFYFLLSNPFTGGPLFPPGGMATTGMEGSLANRAWHLVLPGRDALGHLGRVVHALPAGVDDRGARPRLRAHRPRQGARDRRVVFRHAFRNAALPLVTLIALDLPMVFSGALFTETIFSWPGMGRLFFQSALRRDYPVLMAIVMFTSVLIVLANLLADLAYAYVDPRIRYD
jgi:peptide/nickel transport system permease protein